MLNFILDPKIFNYGMLVLSALAFIRFGFDKDLGNFMYWLFAFGITFTVTFLFKS